MYQVEDEPVETIHLYVMREEPTRPSLTGIILSSIALSILIAIGVFTPYQQPVTRLAIRVPAVPTFIRSYSASVAIIPTGIKNYPATTAHGILTITNGSIIGQSIPAGFTVQGVATDQAVYVPAGDANGYGVATVSAHAILSGQDGNLPSHSINSVEGSSIYIRNLSAFHGGHDSYSINFTTPEDKERALIKAQDAVTLQVSGLHYPCSESYLQSAFVNTVTWRCQFVSYHIPSYMHVLSARLEGKNLLLEVVFTPPRRPGWVK